MGNNLGTQNGGGNVDLATETSSTHIQSTIEQLLRNSNNSYSENMTFDRDTLSFDRSGLSTVGGSALGTESSLLSEFDLESIKEFRQNGGDDRLSVVPRRIRYDTSIEVPQQQPLYVNDSLRRKSIVLSDTSVDNDSLRGGANGESDEAHAPAQMDVFSATSISDNEFKILKDVILRNSTKPQAGGCGCGGDAELPLSSTSPQPVDYSVLKGGADEDEDTDSDDESKDSDESTSDSDEDDNDASSNSGTDTSTTTASSHKKAKKDSDDDDDEDEDDETDDPSEQDKKLSRSKKTSKGKTSKSKKSKKQKREISTSMSGGSEMKINARYMYTSDNDAHFGSDSLSDYYKTFKNRSLL